MCSRVLNRLGITTGYHTVGFCRLSRLRSAASSVPRVAGACVHVDYVEALWALDFAEIAAPRSEEHAGS